MNFIFEIIGLVFFLLLTAMIVEAISVSKEVKELCPNYDVVDASIWTNKVVCYNEEIVNNTYTKMNYTEKLRGRD